jgi:hypothetical protein
MPDNRMTKTEFAQGALSMLVTTQVSLTIQNQLFDRTNIDPDAITGKIVSFGIGGVVGNVTRPYTDKLVEKSAQRVQTWRTNRKQKKSENE